MRLALVVALLLLAAGCGGSHKPAKPGASKLLVKQTVDRGGGIPIEGAYSYVRVEDSNGDKVAERRLEDAEAMIHLDPGSYRLVSYQRTCDGNCRYLDQPSDSCSGGFTISDESSLSAEITVTFGAGCKIVFLDQQSAAGAIGHIPTCGGALADCQIVTPGR